MFDETYYIDEIVVAATLMKLMVDQDIAIIIPSHVPSRNTRVVNMILKTSFGN